MSAWAWLWDWWHRVIHLRTHIRGRGLAITPVLGITGSGQRSGATVPGAPTIGTPVAQNAAATVAWTDGSNGGSAITGYSVPPYIGATSQATHTYTVAETTLLAGIRTATYSGLTNGTAYTFRVAATNAVGTGPQSANSTPVTPTSPVTVPGVPTIGTATAGDTTAAVTWTPGSTGGASLVVYEVQDSTGGHSTTGTNVSTLVVIGLTNGTPYQFRVRATNSAGTSAWSTLSASVTPNATQTVTHGQQINATNTGRTGAAAAGEPTYNATTTTTSGNVTYSTGSNTFNNVVFTGIVTIAGGTQVFNCCRFTVQPPSADSSPAGQVQVTAGTVTFNWCDFDTGLRGTAGVRETENLMLGERTKGPYTGGKVTAYRSTFQGLGNGISMWAWRSAATTTITECFITNQTTGGTTHADCIEIYSSDNVTVQRCRLVNGSTNLHQSCVNITDDGGSSSGNPVIIDANYINHGIAPALTRWYSQGGTYVRNVRFTNNYFGDLSYYGGTVDFCAMNVTDNLAYQQSTDPNCVYWAPTNVWAPDGEGVLNNPYGESGSSGDPTIGRPHVAGATITSANFVQNQTRPASEPWIWDDSTVYGWVGTGGATAPAAPIIGTAVAGNSSATVAWTDGSDGGSAITGYTVTPYIGTTAQTASTYTVAQTTLNGSIRSVVKSGLTNGTAYTFRVAATNAIGTGLPSANSNAVTPTGTVVVPGVPTIGTATSMSATSASVAFTPGSNGGDPGVYYEVTDSAGGHSTPGSASPIVVSGLTTGTVYQFRVRAVNSAGPSAWSALSNSVTPQAPAIGTPPTVRQTTYVAALVSWPDLGATTSYTVTPYLSGVAQTPVTVSASTFSTTVTIQAGQAYNAYAFTVKADSGAESRKGWLWPNANCAGVFAVYDSVLGRNVQASDLTAHVGEVNPTYSRISTNNAVIYRQDFTGKVEVTGSNVTFNQCRFTASSGLAEDFMVTTPAGAAAGAVTFTDCTFRGTNNTTGAYEYAYSDQIGRPSVFRRCLFTEWGEAISTDRTDVRDCCFILSSRNTAVHTETTYVWGGGPTGAISDYPTIATLYKHNTMIQSSQTANSTACIYVDTGGASNYRFENNLLSYSHAGGGATIYAYNGSNTSYVDNFFSADAVTEGGGTAQASVSYWNAGGTWTNNVWNTTGVAVTP